VAGNVADKASGGHYGMSPYIDLDLRRLAANQSPTATLARRARRAALSTANMLHCYTK
jgi:hypothetical protein